MRSKSNIILWITILFSLALVVGGALARRSPDYNPANTAAPVETTDTENTADTGSTSDSAAQRSLTTAELAALKTRYNATLVFAGDINLSEDWSTMEYLSYREGLNECIDPNLLEEMNNADLCVINNEFTFSDRGSPVDGKRWTFRADPDNVSLLTEMGVDVATLANNHVFDYGADAFTDTLTTLNAAGIATVGAGENLAQASAPVYIQVGDLTVAIVNANRSEKTVMTPAAGEDSAGVMSCYDPAAFEQEIAEAAAAADFVVACVHWGTEYSYELEDVQTETARSYIDAGADVIVGTHSHCLQGVEYYQGKPIFYSLGNFWFNSKELETGLLKLTITGGGTGEPQLTCSFIPALQSGCTTTYAAPDTDTRTRVLSLLNRISVNAQADEDGIIRETA